MVINQMIRVQDVEGVAVVDTDEGANKLSCQENRTISLVATRLNRRPSFSTWRSRRRQMRQDGPSQITMMTRGGPLGTSVEIIVPLVLLWGR